MPFKTQVPAKAFGVFQFVISITRLCITATGFDREVLRCGAIHGRRRCVVFDLEPLYAAAMFHDLGLAAGFARTVTSKSMAPRIAVQYKYW
jgi:hypothetical protein